jgi:hypothetical protein
MMPVKLVNLDIRLVVMIDCVSFDKGLSLGCGMEVLDGGKIEVLLVDSFG